MPVGLTVGYYDLDPAAPCSPLKGSSCNIDWRGRLTLCCSLAGYRNAAGEPDVVADLTKEDFAAGYARLREVARAQIERRRIMLDSFAVRSAKPDLYSGSPCLFCLQSFGKIPWRSAVAVSRDEQAGRTLPVLSASSAAGLNIN